MNYQAGDYLAHPGHGGCTVQDICERSFGGETKEYLVLVPETDPSTKILAPVDNAEKIGLREIVSEEKADQLLECLTGDEDGWISDHVKRRQAYEETLKTGSPASLARMIGTLMRHEKLSNADKELLPKAQKKLFSEIALAKGIDYESALSLAQKATI